MGLALGQPFVYPKNSLSYCANFLNMMFSVPAENYENDLNITLRVMMNLIEPVMIVGIACVVVFLLLSVLQAMFMITSSIGESFGPR